MSRAHSTGIREHPGPADGAVPCADCPITRSNEAVYRVPDPRYAISTVSPLCAYHLTVLKREHPLAWRTLRDHPELPDPERYVQEHALVERADVADEIGIDGTRYERLGLDRLGRAYFITGEAIGYRVIETDERFEIHESTHVSSGRLLELFDHVRDAVGWRGLEDDWIERAQREARRGDRA